MIYDPKERGYFEQTNFFKGAIILSHRHASTPVMPDGLLSHQYQSTELIVWARRHL